MAFTAPQLKAMATVAAIVDYYQKEFLASKEAKSAVCLLGLERNKKMGWLSVVEQLADGVGKLYNAQRADDDQGNGADAQDFDLWINNVDALRTEIRSARRLFRRGSNSRLASGLEALVSRVSPGRLNGGPYLPNSPGLKDAQNDEDKNPLLKLVNFMYPGQNMQPSPLRPQINDEDYLQRHLIKRMEKPVRHYTEVDIKRSESIIGIQTSVPKARALRKINKSLNEFYDATVEVRKAAIANNTEAPTFLDHVRSLVHNAIKSSGERYPAFYKDKFGRMLSGIDSIIRKISTFSFGAPEQVDLLAHHDH